MLQRTGKVHRKHGGGSLTLLAVVAGVPAAGQPQPRAAAVAQYTTLTANQKAKLLEALQQRAQASPQLPEGVQGAEPRLGMVPTEVRLLLRPALPFLLSPAQPQGPSSSAFVSSTCWLHTCQHSSMRIALCRG